MNLAPGSLDSRRELGVEIHDRDLVERVVVTKRRDKKHSRLLDLSDEWLRAGLESREEVREAL